MSPCENAAFKSCAEVADAIRAFTPAQWVRLRKIANLYVYSMPADDLLQEAFSRALREGGRHCPGDVDVLRFLAEVMRSIANDEYEKAKLRPILVAVVTVGDRFGEAADPPDPGIRADEWLAREQHAAACREELFRLFDDDPIARDILEGRIAEMTADDLREFTGLDSTGYASKLKLIRRRIEKRFPKGWTS